MVLSSRSDAGPSREGKKKFKEPGEREKMEKRKRKSRSKKRRRKKKSVGREERVKIVIYGFLTN